MSKLLVIKSSILGEHSQSNQLINHAIEGRNDVTVRDLATDPIPVLNAKALTAIGGGEDLSDELQDILDLSNNLVEELKQADTVLIGAPMYNFMVPTQLKNWFDIMARAGVTFSYTEQGPKGLIENKKVVVVTTRGGSYQGTDKEHVTGYLKTVLWFFGLTDVEFVYSESLAMGEEVAQASREKARAELIAKL
ncbi:FMN-dependent NADH-azoreductase [Vibrio sonorensis]|uniref:FMN-dependent NADH-azoreductase n=1 Tax=Vibrio sonorensis TaxID=1004316 RepID=UPI0008D9FF98|nr:FMN-dependent NADH-azoreductase [Vibrio sonorensis]